MSAARPDACIQNIARPSLVPGRWGVFDPMRPFLLPTSPAVYVIFFDREPVYVGQTNNLRVRFQRHQIRYGYARNIRTAWGEISDEIAVAGKAKLSKRYGDWAMWELRLIKKLRPRLNGTFVGPRGAERIA